MLTKDANDFLKFLYEQYLALRKSGEPKHIARYVQGEPEYFKNKFFPEVNIEDMNDLFDELIDANMLLEFGERSENNAPLSWRLSLPALLFWRKSE